MAVRVILADDHVIVRQGLKALLEREGYEVVGEASNGHEAIKLAETTHPEVVILDISMPLLNGIDAAREILGSAPRTKVILLTMFTEEHYVYEALRAGVSAYVLKTKAANELVSALQEVIKGDTYLSPGISRTVVQAYLSKADTPSDPLTARERQVIQLVAEGKTTKEIATVLGISTKTAESHRTNIMEKLNIHDIAGLVRYAIRHGIVAS
ncbi:MAG TPA: response regulator transcription factor [Terriglobales bacterium]|nr:response regulator transcription factor [Terriglobales bacterium]